MESQEPCSCSGALQALRGAKDGFRMASMPVQGYRVHCPGCGFISAALQQHGQLQHILARHPNPSTGAQCRHLCQLQDSHLCVAAAAPGANSGPHQDSSSGGQASGQRCTSLLHVPASWLRPMPEPQAVRLMGLLLANVAMHITAATGRSKKAGGGGGPDAQRLLPLRDWAVRLLTEDVAVIEQANWVRPSPASLISSLTGSASTAGGEQGDPTATPPAAAAATGSTGAAAAAAAAAGLAPAPAQGLGPCQPSESAFRDPSSCPVSLLDLLLAPPWVAVSEPNALEVTSLERTAVFLSHWHAWLQLHRPASAAAGAPGLLKQGHMLRQRKQGLSHLLGAVLALDPVFGSVDEQERLEAFFACAGISGGVDQALTKLDAAIRTKPHLTTHVEACAYCGLSCAQLRIYSSVPRGSRRHAPVMCKCAHCLVSVCVPCVLVASGRVGSVAEVQPHSIGEAEAAEAAGTWPQGLCPWCLQAGVGGDGEEIEESERSKGSEDVEENASGGAGEREAAVGAHAQAQAQPVQLAVPPAVGEVAASLQQQQQQHADGQGTGSQQQQQACLAADVCVRQLLQQLRHRQQQQQQQHSAANNPAAAAAGLQDAALPSPSAAVAVDAAAAALQLAAAKPGAHASAAAADWQLQQQPCFSPHIPQELLPQAVQQTQQAQHQQQEIEEYVQHQQQQQQQQQYQEEQQEVQQQQQRWRRQRPAEQAELYSSPRESKRPRLDKGMMQAVPQPDESPQQQQQQQQQQQTPPRQLLQRKQQQVVLSPESGAKATAALLSMHGAVVTVTRCSGPGKLLPTPSPSAAAAASSTDAGAAADAACGGQPSPLQQLAAAAAADVSDWSDPFTASPDSCWWQQHQQQQSGRLHGGSNQHPSSTPACTDADKHMYSMGMDLPGVGSLSPAACSPAAFSPAAYGGAGAGQDARDVPSPVGLGMSQHRAPPVDSTTAALQTALSAASQRLAALSQQGQAQDGQPSPAAAAPDRQAGAPLTAGRAAAAAAAAGTAASPHGQWVPGQVAAAAGGGRGAGFSEGQLGQASGFGNPRAAVAAAEAEVAAREAAQMAAGALQEGMGRPRVVAGLGAQAGGSARAMTPTDVTTAGAACGAAGGATEGTGVRQRILSLMQALLASGDPFARQAAGTLALGVAAAAAHSAAQRGPQPATTEQQQQQQQQPASMTMATSGQGTGPSTLQHLGRVEQHALMTLVDPRQLQHQQHYGQQQQQQQHYGQYQQHQHLQHQHQQQQQQQRKRHLEVDPQHLGLLRAETTPPRQQHHQQQQQPARQRHQQQPSPQRQQHVQQSSRDQSTAWPQQHLAPDAAWWHQQQQRFAQLQQQAEAGAWSAADCRWPWEGTFGAAAAAAGSPAAAAGMPAPAPHASREPGVPPLVAPELLHSPAAQQLHRQHGASPQQVQRQHVSAPRQQLQQQGQQNLQEHQGAGDAPASVAVTPTKLAHKAATAAAAGRETSVHLAVQALQQASPLYTLQAAALQQQLRQLPSNWFVPAGADQAAGRPQQLVHSLRESPRAGQQQPQFSSATAHSQQQQQQQFSLSPVLQGGAEGLTGRLAGAASGAQLSGQGGGGFADKLPPAQLAADPPATGAQQQQHWQAGEVPTAGRGQPFDIAAARAMAKFARMGMPDRDSGLGQS